MRTSLQLGLFALGGFFVMGCMSASKGVESAPPPKPTQTLQQDAAPDAGGEKAKEITGDVIVGKGAKSPTLTDDNIPEGGLGLTGTGPGGGGTGEGIGLGSTGTIGHGAGIEAGAGSLSGRKGSVQGATASSVGSLDPEVIKRVLQAAAPKIKACYETALEKDPKVAGRLPIRFTIDPGGRVINAAPSDATIAEATLSSCVVQCIQSLQFPAPQNGGVVVVTYPFIFQPG